MLLQMAFAECPPPNAANCRAVGCVSRQRSLHLPHLDMNSAALSATPAGSHSTSASDNSVHKSLREYARGVAGGLIFSLPLLFTMEMWWAGFILSPERLLGCVAGTFVLLLGYNRFAGLHEDASWAEVAIDSVEEMGLGLLLSTAILWLLGRIEFGMAASEIVSKIVIEAMTVAIGVSVGTAQLGGASDEANEAADESQSEKEAGFGGQVVIAGCGAILFAANVAPTEEIIMLGIELSPGRLLGIALFSLLLGAVVLYCSDFRGAQRLSPARGPLSIVSGIVVTYAVALLSAAAILWFFGRFDGMHISKIVAQTVVLGLPATLGASAGRLLLQRQ